MHTVKNLGRNMPDTANDSVSVAQHACNFYAFDTCDVWTADGWLVVAVQDNSTTHHVRKGTIQATVELAPSDRLYYKASDQTLYFGFGTPTSITSLRNNR